MRNFSELLKLRVQKSPFFALLLGTMLYFFSLTVLMLGITILVPNASTILQGSFADTSAMHQFRLLQGINQVFSWGVPGAILLYLMGELKPQLGIGRKVSPMSLGVAMLCIILSLPMVQAVSFDAESFRLPAAWKEWEQQIHSQEAQALAMLESILDSKHYGILLFNVVIFALLPAICEELFFRGFLQRNLARMLNIHLAIVLSACIFSLVHWQFYGFFARMLLGILLGYLALGARNLIPAMLAHFSFNLFSIVIYFVANQNGIELGGKGAPEHMTVPLSWALISGVFIVACMQFYLNARGPKSDDTL